MSEMDQLNQSIVLLRKGGDEKITTLASVKRFQWLGLLLALVGLLGASFGEYANREQFWQSYLLAYLFWLQLPLGCLGLVMLHHLVGGRWSALIRRLMETGAMTLPLMVLLFIPLLFGLTRLYPWANAEHVAQSELLQQKTAWLNLPFFLGRAVLYFAVWLTLAVLLNRWSLAQDQTGDSALAPRMRRLSAVGMILYMLKIGRASCRERV